MITKYIEYLVYLMSFATLVVLLYSFINGSACRYDIRIQSMENRDTFVTCYRGKVMVLHSLFDEQNQLASKWQVSARQLKLGKQMIYLIYDRQRIEGSTTNNENDRYNEIFSGYKILFYHVEVKGDKVFVFENFPENNVIEGQIEGFMDLWQMARFN